MEKELISLVEDLLNTKDVNLNSTSDNTANWDSLNQINIVTSIEEEFSIEFEGDEILELNSIAKLLKRIQEKTC